MSDGWETARSRVPGHKDWAIVKLGSRTKISSIEVDTAFYRGNYPEYIEVEAIDDANAEAPSPENKNWETVASRTKGEADKIHKFDVTGDKSYTHVKLTMIPDGGVKRVRVWGVLDPK